MTAQAKIALMEAAEKALRRKLSGAEKSLLQKIISEVLDKLDLKEGKLSRTDANNLLTNKITQIFEQFQKSHVLPIAAELARSFLSISSINKDYYSTQVDTARLRAKVEKITSAAAKYIRAKVGIDANGKLVPGGYLQSITEDVTVRNEVRRILSQAIDGEKDLAGLRRDLRNYLIGTPELEVEGKAVPAKPGALQKRFDQQVFELLQEADRAVNLQFANSLDLVFAAYQGGIIERTRKFCCERNDRFFTREEIEAMDKLEWAGKKGKPDIYGGGYQCRHQWMFVSTSRGLKERTDVKRVLHKEPGKKGYYTYTHTRGVDDPPLNNDCDERK